MSQFYHKMACCLVAACTSLTLWAQGPTGSKTYYQEADGQKGAQLKTAMARIISQHTTLSYDQLWSCFATTDVRPDGSIRDRYSAVTRYQVGEDQDRGSHRKEGDTYNREHSLPKSWFDDKSPMVSDLYHIYPTDSYVNGMRGNYPFGETTGSRYTSRDGYSKLGISTSEGYGGVVFEPADEWKGDFARTYFYMVTCYEGGVRTWHGDMLDGSSYPAFRPWALRLLMQWARQDPVDSLEAARNVAVSVYQGNRNPFIDYPGLEEYIWGEKMTEAFSYTRFAAPVKASHHGETAGTAGGNDPVPPVPDPAEPGEETQPAVDGEARTYVKVTSESGLQVGARYLIVNETGGMALGRQDTKFRAAASVTLGSGSVTAVVGTADHAYEIELRGSAGAYELYDVVSGQSLSLTSDGNVLYSLATVGDDRGRWSITLNDGLATIASVKYPGRSICYNGGASPKRFACYLATSNQKPVALYRLQATSSTTNSVDLGTTGHRTAGYVDVYDLTGRRLRRQVQASEALTGLRPGVYLVGGKAVVAR